MFKIFGHRALLDHWKPATGNRIIQPDTAGNNDVLRWGIVSDVGDGKFSFSMRDKLAGRGFDCKQPIPSLVQPGDKVCFEINQTIMNTQVYRNWRSSKDHIHMLQTDLVGRLKGEEICIDNFEVLGDFVLVKPFVKQNSIIVIPDEAAKNVDFVYFKVVQKGSTVDIPIEIGQEIIVNLGCVNTLIMSKLNGSSWAHDEYGYVLKNYVIGTTE